jgi:hypothetical protein
MTKLYGILKAAEDKHYIMSAGTLASGNDTTFNRCGIANSHAYSVLSAFEMRDSNNNVHKMAMLRNPWGKTFYNWSWSMNDTRWTQALVNQVPYGFDPRKNDSGIFVMPIEGFNTTCVNIYSIGHLRKNEDYKSVWYDSIGQNNNVNTFVFTAPEK